MKNCTIIIPTFERPNFLSMQIAWLNYEKFEGRLLIADSSSDQIFRSNAKLIKDAKFETTHIDCRGLPEKDSTKKSIDVVTSEYVCWTGDDDFQVMSGLNKTLNFLKKNRNIGAARGQGIRLYLDKIANNSHNFFFRTYDPPLALGDNFEKRLKSFMKNGGGDTHYSVCRTDILRESYKNVHLINDRILGAACLPIIMTLKQTELVRLNHLSLFKGLHSKRYVSSETVFEKLAKDEYVKDLQNLYCLTNGVSNNSDYKRQIIDRMLLFIVFGHPKFQQSFLDESMWKLRSIYSTIRYLLKIKEFKEFYRNNCHKI